EGRVIVGRWWIPASGEQVIVDIDHAADDPLQISLDDGLIDPAAQIRIRAPRGDRPKRVDIGGHEQEFAGDELGVTCHRRSAVIARLTYARSICRYRRCS